MSIGSVSKTKSTNVVLKGTPKTKVTKKTTKTFNQLFVELKKRIRFAIYLRQRLSSMMITVSFQL